MKRIAYASALQSLMYTLLCTRLDIYFVVRVTRFQSNPRLEHWVAVKHILKFLRRIRDYVLVCLEKTLLHSVYKLGFSANEHLFG